MPSLVTCRLGPSAIGGSSASSQISAAIRTDELLGSTALPTDHEHAEEQYPEGSDADLFGNEEAPKPPHGVSCAKG